MQLINAITTIETAINAKSHSNLRAFVFGLPLLCLTILLLAGCSTPTQVDTGRIQASTFNFIRPTARQVGANFSERDQQVHTFIQESITANMADRHVNRVAQGGDITVAYLIIVGNNANTTAINDYFSYTEDGIELAEQAQKAYNKHPNQNYFEAGTLLVDLIDNRTQKVVMRNYVVRPLSPNASPEERRNRIQQAVNEVLYDARIVP
jgi:hypothetical protein